MHTVGRRARDQRQRVDGGEPPRVPCDVSCGDHSRRLIRKGWNCSTTPASAGGRSAPRVMRTGSTPPQLFRKLPHLREAGRLGIERNVLHPAQIGPAMPLTPDVNAPRIAWDGFPSNPIGRLVLVRRAILWSRRTVRTIAGACTQQTDEKNTCNEREGQGMLHYFISPRSATRTPAALARDGMAGLPWSDTARTLTRSCLSAGHCPLMKQPRRARRTIAAGSLPQGDTQVTGPLSESEFDKRHGA